MTRQRESEHQRGHTRDQPVQERTVRAEHAGPDPRDELHERPGRGDATVGRGARHREQNGERAAEIEHSAHEQCAGPQTACERYRRRRFGHELAPSGDVR